MSEIETLQDWNDRISQCGCCEMPSCEEPQRECKSKLLNSPYFYDSSDVAGGHATDCDFKCGRWSKIVEEWDHDYNYSDPIPDPPGGNYSTETDTGTLTRTRTYTDPFAGTETDVLAGTATHTITDYNWDDDDDVWNAFRIRVWTTEPNGTGDGWETTHTDSLIPGNDYTAPGSASLLGNFDSVLSSTADKLEEEYSLSGVTTGTETIEGFDRIDQSAYESDVSDWWVGKTADSAEVDETDCDASREWVVANTTCGGTTEDRDCWTTARERRVFYRWTIPDAHTGSYFKIEWDEVFFPDGGGASTVTAKSWEWSGGDRVSPWSLLVSAPAGEIGVTELRNVRYICYRSPNGSKPIIHGSFESHTP